MKANSGGATSGALVKIFSDKLGATTRNARFLAQCLRDAGMLSGSGAVGHGARLSTADAGSWLLGQILAPSLPKAAETIQKFRKARTAGAIYSPSMSADGEYLSPEHNAGSVAYFTHGLGAAAARTFGKALDALIDDMRSGAFARWKEDVPVRLTFEFHDSGHVVLYLDRPHFGKAVVFNYGNKDEAQPVLSRVTRLDGVILEDIAAALGPPD